MLNVSVLQGRLVKEPELEMCGSNGDIARLRFTLACERSYAAKGQERKTDFIDCVAWRQTAEFIAKFFKKGSLILVEGATQTDVVEKDDGTKRKYTQINVTSVNFCGSKKDNAGGENASAPAQAASAASAQNGGTSGDGGEDLVIDDDEDLPF